MEEYDRRDVERLTGESETTIQYYVRNHVVIPEISAPSGRGRALKFSRNNVVQFSMIRILQREHQMQLLSMKAIFDHLREGKWGNLRFQDFYTHPQWGADKELVYMETAGTERTFEFFIFGPDQPLPEEQLRDALVQSGLRLIPLGLIKKQAEKNLALT